MGEIKTYMVVTNDEYEHIVKADLKGAKSAGEFLGITASSVNSTSAVTDGERNINTRSL